MIFFVYILPGLLVAAFARGMVQETQRELERRNIRGLLYRKYLRLAGARSVVSCALLFSFFVGAFHHDHQKWPFGVAMLLFLLFGGFIFNGWYDNRLNQDTENPLLRVPVNRWNGIGVVLGIAVLFGFHTLHINLNHLTVDNNQVLNLILSLFVQICFLVVVGLIFRACMKNK